MRRILLFLFSCAPLLATGPLDVRDFGARGDGRTNDTTALQRAIDAASRKDGGTVFLPAGTYISGTLHLKSHVSIYLSSGAVLSFSPDNTDFDPYEKLPYNPRADRETAFFHYALVAAENADDIAILGEGEINGNRLRRGGPKPIALKNCRYVTIQGITIRDAPNYAISFLGCDYVQVDGVTIQNAYADGIDPDCSRFVRIANCFIDSIDDAICLKASPALGYPRSTDDVTVTNCVLRSSSIDFKLGTESYGDFRNITVTNCSLFRGLRSRHGNPGLALETVDGGTIQGMVASNIAMQGVGIPIFLRRGKRPGARQPGALEDVTFSNIVATGARGTSVIAGLAEYPVKHVYLHDIHITVAGPPQSLRDLNLPELPAAYPDPTMFGTLPASGLYCRYAVDVTFRNVEFGWTARDPRPALVFDGVNNLELNGFGGPAVTSRGPMVWLNRVRNALIRGFDGRQPRAFFRTTNSASRDIRFR